MQVHPDSSKRNANDAAGWIPLVLADDAAMRAFALDVRTAFPDVDMNYDVEWLCAAHGWPRNEIVFLANRQRGEIKGYAAFLGSRSHLTFALGPVVLWRRSVRQLKLYQGILLRPDSDLNETTRCFEALEKAMGEGVVYAGAVPTGTTVHEALTQRSSSLHRQFHVLPWGAPSLHCRIRWEGSVDRYLETISRQSRKDLRRNARALMSDESLTCVLKRFDSPADLDRFIADGVRLSDKTYQKKDLGLGISMGGAVERTIRLGAARGQFLGYILYIKGEPVAFQYCFVVGRTCTMKQTGFDPAWRHKQVGAVLFIEMLRDLERIKLPVDWLDFMPDLNLFKLRTTNDKRQIRHYYLFRRTLGGTTQYLTLKAMDVLSRAVGSMRRRRKAADFDGYLNVS